MNLAMRLFPLALKKNPWLASPWRWALVAVIVILVIGGLWHWLGSGGAKVTYVTEPVVRGSIENLVTATGSLQPRQYVDVGAQVSGQLKKIHVEVGSEVKAGDLLAEIDATVYAAKVDGTRAQLSNLKAQLLDRQAQLQLAEIQYRRQQNLQKEEATTAEALQMAEADLTSAHAQLKSLEAQIQQQESSLRVEAANLNFAKIYAPMDGTVVSIDARQGQTLNTNQMAPTLMRVADLSTMTVKTQVSEADISKLTNGMEVYFTTLGGQERRWYSKLDRIQPTPEVVNNVVLYNALFDVPNEQGLLMPQMSTQVFFIVAQAKEVLLVPMSAVNFSPVRAARRGATQSGANQPDANRKNSAENKRPESSGRVQVAEGAKHNTDSRPAIVRIINAKGQLEERRVMVGVTNRIQAEIVEGLTENDQVVTGERSAESANKPVQAGGWGGPRMMR
jgi:macrolide-specific efflux system membrane fusion protein